MERADEAPEYNPPCERGQDDRRSDLCAQWKAADAAHETAVWTVHTFWLGVVGAFIGFLTFAAASAAALFAKRAAYYAKVGADEAERTANAAEAAYSADTKPYLVVDPVAGDAVRWNEDGLAPERVLFTIMNVGRGPAIVTALYRRWIVTRDGALPPVIDFRDKETPPKGVHIPIGPNSRSHRIDAQSTWLGKHEGLTEEARVWFTGYIEFRDISGQRYVAGFTHVLRLKAPELGLHVALTPEEGYIYHRELKELPKV